jgi:FtsP/CotA-like multicopper oxidase with cupredoxin domain
MAMLGALAGFGVVVAFGAGLVSMAVFDADPVIGGSEQVSAAAADEIIEVELGDLYIKPESLEVGSDSATIKVTNAGATEHNFVVPGIGKSPMLAPGSSTTVKLTDLEPGTYTYYCEVSGHREGGMEGTLTVEGEAAAGGSANGGHQGMAGMSAEQMAEHDAAVTARFPEETEVQGGRVLEPQIVDGVRVFELTADEVRWEVTKGVFKEGMAYNGQIPGPQLHAELGDKVRIELTNELDEPTVLHLHGMTLPNGMDGVPAITQDAVLPGESFSYEFTVRNTGSNMYHSHFNAASQVPSGLLGAFIVADPKDPVVDHDMTMILNDGPLGFTINGKGFPATAPIVAEEGDLVRIRYMNEGLQIHPMHLHGIPQKVVSKDGHILKHPYMADTVLVGPGERYDVLVEATELGAWAFHCHVLNHVEGPDGMFGMVTALVVQ